MKRTSSMARTSCRRTRRCPRSPRSSLSSITSGRTWRLPREHRAPRPQSLHEIVSIADVYDALRSNRVYREGLPSERVRAIMTQKDSPAFNTRLLGGSINLMGLFPVGTLVRLSTDEVAVVTHEHPTDPFRPQVKVLLDRLGERRESPILVNTWEPDERGDFPFAVVEAVDPDTVPIDGLDYL